MKRSGQMKLVVALFGGLLILLLLLASMFTVNERELAVVLQFGQPVKSIKEPGLYFKMPLIQEVARLPRTQQFWHSSRAETLVDLPTRDSKKIEVSAWFVWRITDPEQFVRVMRTVSNAETQVKTRVRSAIRDVITSYDLDEVVRSSDRKLQYTFRYVQSSGSGEGTEESAEEVAPIEVGREKIIAEIRKSVQDLLAGSDNESADGSQSEGSQAGSFSRGIELVDVGISNISFVPSVREAAFKRLVANMESIAAGYTNEGLFRKQEIINQTNAEVEKLIGEGEEQSNIVRGEVDAEIIEKYAAVIEQTGDFYNFIKTLEVYEKAMSDDTQLILTTDSDLLRLLKAVRPASDE